MKKLFLVFLLLSFVFPLWNQGVGTTNNFPDEIYLHQNPDSTLTFSSNAIDTAQKGYEAYEHITNLNYILATDYATFAFAIDAAEVAEKTLLITQQENLTNDDTIDVPLYFSGKGKIVPNPGVTLKINKMPFAPPDMAIFDTTGIIDLPNETIPAGWFGIVADGNFVDSSGTDNGPIISNIVNEGIKDLKFPAGIIVTSKTLPILGQIYYEGARVGATHRTYIAFTGTVDDTSCVGVPPRRYRSGRYENVGRIAIKGIRFFDWRKNPTQGWCIDAIETANEVLIEGCWLGSFPKGALHWGKVESEGTSDNLVMRYYIQIGSQIMAEPFGLLMVPIIHLIFILLRKKLT